MSIPGVARRTSMVAAFVALSVAVLQAADARGATLHTESFPSPSTTRFTQMGQRFWNQGDYAQEWFTLPGMTRVTALSLDLPIEPNSLVDDTQDTDVLINGVLLGSYQIALSDTLIELDFADLDVAGVGPLGEDYLLRVETNRTVAEGQGSAGLADGLDNLKLTAVPEPTSMAMTGLALLGCRLGRRARNRSRDVR